MESDQNFNLFRLLTSQSSVTLNNPPGCFHVARCLWMCARVVRDIVAAGGVEK